MLTSKHKLHCKRFFVGQQTRVLQICFDRNVDPISETRTPRQRVNDGLWIIGPLVLDIKGKTAGVWQRRQPCVLKGGAACAPPCSVTVRNGLRLSRVWTGSGLGTSSLLFEMLCFLFQSKNRISLVAPVPQAVKKKKREGGSPRAGGRCAVSSCCCSIKKKTN